MGVLEPSGKQESLFHIHERPKKYLEEWLDVPAHIHHVAYRMKDPPSERPQSRDEFRQVLSNFDIPEEFRFIAEKFGYGTKVESNGDRLVIVWEAHTEYYSYQVWHIPDDKTLPLEFGPITSPQYEFPVCPLGERINALDIIVSQETQVVPEYLSSLLPGPHIYGSQIFGDEISVATSFTPDEYARERYFVFSDSLGALLRHIAKVVEGIVTGESYYHLLLLPYADFAQAVDLAHKFEQRHVEQRTLITAQLSTSTSDTLQQWMNRLTQDFLEVSRFAETMRFQLSASVPYDAIIRATVKSFQERPLPPFLPLSDFIIGGTSGVADGYQQLIRRIDSMEKDFEGMISVIRTRVDLMSQDQNLALQDQNLQLLKSVDRTTKSQAILQHTVEALSVIVIAYYMSGLASYVIKGLHEAGLIPNATIPTAIFAVSSLIISFALIVVGRMIINKRMNHMNSE